MSLSESFVDFIKEQPKPRLVVGAALILGFLFLVIVNPYDRDYYIAVEKEIPLARAICENSLEWVMADPTRLKMRNNSLEDILVDGEKVELKHIKYPRAIILHDGYAHRSAQIELYCFFKDPRGGQDHFYDYRKGIWIDKTLSRR